MKLNNLASGNFFQFSRSNSPSIHQVIDPALGTYITIGQYVRGLPIPFCTHGDCQRHIHPCNGKSNPGRNVHRKLIDFEHIPEGMSNHDYLDTLE